jgi:hypothetical protein
VVAVIEVFPAASTHGVKEREIAIAELAIKTSCRRFRIPGQYLKGMNAPLHLPPGTCRRPYQSKTIIGGLRGSNNDSKGNRTTVVMRPNYHGMLHLAGYLDPTEVCRWAILGSGL